jgi:hypothetical protein
MESNGGEGHEKPISITTPVSRRRREARPADVITACSRTNPADADIPGRLDQYCSTLTVSSSSCGDGEGRATEQARPSYRTCQGCEDVLHELSGVITGVLINAQVLGWKLPPYSHLKRPVHEMERNAQRGGELLRRLLQHCNGKA